ncbi:Calx-beta domain-containing protein [Actinoplanes sp. CA-142083]|uniref:Calx-beta domain-containing protein n=1 Tax=Actinoplanes sp. CA-142083 TaxID=3239903 RepID=UPI003D93259E
MPAVFVASPAQAATVAASYSVANASATEAGTITFTITQAAPGAGNDVAAEDVAIALGDVTTSAGDHGAPSPASVHFNANASNVTQTMTFTVATTADTTDEADETFSVTLTPNNGGSATGGTGTIIDDDNPTYTLTAAPSTVSESLSAGSRHATITATLATAAVGTVTIPVSTLDGTAKAGEDYTALSGTISITNGNTTGTAQVDVIDDNIDEPDIQSFTVNGAPGTGVTGTQSVTVNISDDDAPPVINIASGGTVTEGSPAPFTVTLTGRSEQTVTAKYDTSDGPAAAPSHGIAKAGADYTAAAAATVSIPPLATAPTTPLTIATLGDNTDEVSPEDFSVTLSQPTNASLGVSATAVDGINDSGTASPPQVVLSPMQIDEGSATTPRARTFSVKLSKASGREQKVHYAVAGGTGNGGLIGAATAGQDFVTTSGDLTFAPGDTEKTFTIDVIGDAVDEDDGENMAVTLTDVNSTALSAGQSLGTNQVLIKDDDAKPVISLAQTNIAMPEGNGYSAALFQVNLSNPSTHIIDWDVNYATPDAGTAQENLAALGSDDYDLMTDPGSNPQSIPVGATSGYVLILVKGDTVFEADETAKFTVSLTAGETDATGGPLNATLTLTNDDTAPVLVVDAKNVKEGDNVALTGVTEGSAQGATVLNLTLAGKKNGTAAAAQANDFSPASFLVNVAAGTANGATVSIGNLLIADDTTSEPDEAIEISGTGFAGSGSVKPGFVTIAASDGGKPGEPGGPGEPSGKLTISAPKNILGAVAVPITGKAPADSTVDLWSAPMGGGGELKKILSTKSDKDGNYSFSRWIGEGTRFGVASGEDKTDEVMVTVTQNPVFVASSPSKGTLSLAVQGNPRGPGQTVIVQRAVNGAWVNAWRGTTGSDNIWRGSAKIASGTVVTVRAFVAGYTPDGLAPGYTAAKKITIK